MIARTGAWISAIGHGALILIALFGVPSSGPERREPLLVTEVTFVSQAEFAAATRVERPDVGGVEDATAEPTALLLDSPEPIVTAPEVPAASPRPQSPPSPTEAAGRTEFTLPEPSAPKAAGIEVVGTSPDPIEPASLALSASGRPMARPAPARDVGAESLIEALKREVAKEIAQRKLDR